MMSILKKISSTGLSDFSSGQITPTPDLLAELHLTVSVAL